MSFLPDNLDESTRRYSDSFVGLKVKGEIHAFKVARFFRDDDRVIKCQGTDYTTRRPKTVNVDKLVFKTPKLGVVNLERQAVLVTKTPARQWRRGLSRRNTAVSNILKSECRLARQVTPSNIDNSALVTACFNPKYPTPNEAIEKIKSLEVVSVAFSNTLFLGISKKHENIGVYRKGLRIGYLDDEDRAVIYSGCEHFFDELSQYIPCVMKEK